MGAAALTKNMARFRFSFHRSLTQTTDVVADCRGSRAGTVLLPYKRSCEYADADELSLRFEYA